MKTRQKLLLGLAGLGFVLAAPTYAGPASVHEGFALSVQLAARDNAEPRYEQRREREFREFKDDERGRGRHQQSRDNERNVPQEYGYGYERRQQPLPPREEGRHRH